jgi:toxoflavin biosynthesis protein ToxD
MGTSNQQSTGEHTVGSQLKFPEMIHIPSGTLLMGISDADVQRLLEAEDWADEWYAKGLFKVEQPQHRVELPAFEIARLPVTNADYHQFVWDAGYQAPRFWMGFHFLEEEAENPVVGVSRQDALAYCEWLSSQPEAIQEGARYRLPSEAEWERAARGADTRTFPWGDSFDPWRCNTIESGRRTTTQVGIFSPGGDSPWGISDLAGNVWEWTASLFKPYPYDPLDGREDLGAKGLGVVRGGSWYYSRKLARCTSRESLLPTFTSPMLGFRLARTP